MQGIAAVLLLALAATVSGGPIGKTSTCATECKESDKFKYQPGSVYEYKYEADILTTVHGSAREHSGVHFSGTAVIQVEAPCEFSLTLRGVKLENSDPRNVKKRTRAINEKAFRAALESRPLKFSFQDGRVEHICTSGDESTWALNVQRGVLSAFQNSMEHTRNDHTVTETDITGKCEAHYKINERSYARISVSKSKNLLGCTDRHHLLSVFQGNAYRVPSDIQSLPLMKSTHDCEQTFAVKGHMEKTTCHEIHVFRPFSKQTNGAKTTVSQSMRFVRRHQNTQPLRGALSQRSSLLFGHEKSEMARQAERKEAEEILRAVCKQVDSRPNTAELFSRLVARLRTFDPVGIRDLHEMVDHNRVCPNNHERAKTFFTDAIPMVSTSGALGLVREMVLKGEVSGIKSDAWMTTIAFIAKPTLDMLREIKPVLEKSPRKQTVLAVSSLVNSYCRVDSECAYQSEVQDITNALLTMLGRECSGEHDRVMLALKALGNTGAALDAVPTLNSCVKSRKLSMGMRVQAINAFRRLPCVAERNVLMDLLQDAESDSELRINAYLAVMKCPTTSTINTVRRLLESEKTNQVGSFIWTHLSNLKETSDPLKQEIRSILEDEPLKTTFNLDQRKFSRNYEASFFMNSINTGAQVESNLIWSSKSYIPRSAMLNLTVDMFGQSVNLLELGGRVEGMEEVLETFFGPDGYFHDKKSNSVSKRGKRAASKDPLARLHKLFNAKSEDSAQASMYMKIFGNELGYFDSHDFGLDKDSFNFLELLIKLATDHKVDFRKSAVFLDTSTTVPTVVGLPLKLAVKGVASVEVHVEGHADVRKVATSPRSMDVKGSVRPSGTVEVTGFMTLDVGEVTSGLKMVATMHSSTVMDGSFLVSDGKAMNVRLNMPQDKTEILHVQSKFMLLVDGKEREQKMNDAGRTEKKYCTGALVHKALGVKMCGEVSVPRVISGENEPFFPMTGPAEVKLYIDKTDKHSAYTLDLGFENKKSFGYPAVLVKAAVNTPDSKIDRDIGVEFLLKGKEMETEFSVRTPWKKLAISGSITNKKVLKAANVKLVWDKTRVWAITTELQVDDRKQVKRYSPKVVIVRPGAKDITLEGSLLYKVNKGCTINVALNNLLKKPVTLKGSTTVINTKKINKYSVNLNLASQMLTTKVVGFVEKRATRVTSRLQASYNAPGMKGQRLVFDVKIRDLSNKAMARRNVKMALQTTQFPDYNAQLTVDALKNAKKAVMSGDLMYGAKRKDPNKRITLKQILNFAKKGKFFTADYNMKLTHKAQKIDIKTKVDHRHSNNELKTLTTIQYKPGKVIKYNMILKKDLVKPIKVSAQIDLAYPGRAMKFSNDLIERSANNYHHEMILQWQKAKQLRTMTVYTRRGNRHEVKSEITVPKKNPITLTGSTVLDKDDFSVAAAADYSGNKYATGLSYSYSFGAKPNMKASVDLEYPSRHITAEGQLSKTGNSYKSRADVKWNVGKDGQDRLLIDGAVVNAKQKDVSLKIKYPARLITLNLNHNLKADKYISHGEVSWSPRDKISADSTFTFSKLKNGMNLESDLRLVTPFKPVENLKMNLKHKCNGEKYISNFVFSWAAGKQIQADSSFVVDGLSEISGKATLSTPYQALKSATASVQHKISKTKLSTKGDIAWNKEKVEINVNGKRIAYKAKTIMDGSVEMKTTFAALKNAAFRSENVLFADQFTSHKEAEWNEKLFQLDTKGKLDASKADVEGSVRVRTPFKVLKDVSISAKHSGKSQQFANEAEIKWGKGKVITYNGNLFFKAWKTEASVKVTTPFEGMDNMAFSIDGEVSKGKLKLHTEAARSRRRAVFELDANHESTYYSRDIGATVVVKSPYNSDISISITHHNGQKNLKSTLEVTHKKEKKVQFLIEGDMTDSIVGKMELKTPIDYLKDISAHVSARTKNPYSGHLEMQWSSKQKISVDGELTYQGLRYMKGELRATSPFSGFERIILSGQHSSSNDRVNTHAQLEYSHKKKIAVTSKVNLANGISMELELDTPFRCLRSFSLSGSHRGPLKSFTNEITVAYQGNEKINFNSKLRTKTNPTLMINGNFHLTTPYEYLEDVSGQLSHDKRRGQWVSKAELSLTPEKKISLETTFTNDKQIKVTAALNSAYDTIPGGSLSLEHSGELSSFETKGMLNVPKYLGKTNIEIAFNKDDLTGSISIVNPSASFRKIAASVEHKYDGRHRYNTKAVLEYAGKTISLTSAVRMPSTENFEIAVTLITPFPSAQTTSVKYIHHGSSRRFNCQAELQRNNEIKSKLDINFDSTKTIGGSIVLSTPYSSIRNLNVAFKHDGNLRAFTSTASLIHNSDKKVDFKGKFNSKEGLDIDFALKTPFENMQKLQFILKHEGSMKNFETEAQVIYNENKKVEVDASLKLLGPAKSASLSLTTPFENFEEQSIVISHSGNYKNFRNHLEVSYGSSKKIQVDGRLSSGSKIDALFQFRSPFKNFENIFLSLDHQGGISDFTCHCEFSYAADKKIKVDGRLDTKNALNADFKISTPFRRLHSLDLVLGHKGSTYDFTTHGELAINGNEPHTIDAEYSKKAETIHGKLQLKSSLINDETWKIEGNHAGGLSRFSSDVNVFMDGRNKFKANVEFQTRPIDLLVRIQSPLHYRLKNVEFTLKHSGSFKAFNTEVELSYDEGKISYTGDFTTENMGGRFTFSTPYTKKVLVAFSHQSEDRYVAHYEVGYGSDKIQLDAELARNWREGSIRFQSPFDVVDNLYASFQHSGPASDFQNEIEFVYRKTKKFILNTEMRGMSASLRVRTPFPSMRDVSLSFSQNSVVMNMEVSYNGDKYSGRIKRHSNQIKVNLDSPIDGYKHMSAIVFHRMNNKMASLDIKVNNGKEKLLMVDVDMKWKPKIVADISFQMKTPWERIQPIELNLKHSGNLLAFNTQGDVSYGKSKVRAEIDWKLQPEMKLTAEVTTPFDCCRQLNVEFTHSGSIRAFTTIVKISKDGSLLMEAIESFNSIDYIEASSKTTIPSIGLDNAGFTFKHTGTSSNCNTHIEVSNGDKRMIGDLLFNIEDDKEIKLTVTTPFSQYNEIVLHEKFTGSQTDFENEMSVKYAPRSIISMKTSFKKTSSNIRASASLSTPFSQLRSASAQLNHNGDLKAFSTNAYVMFGREKIEFNSEYQSRNGQPLKGSALVKSTFETLENIGGGFDVSSERGGSKKMRVNFSWAPRKTVTITTVYKINNGYSNKEFDVSVTTETPFQAMRTGSGSIYYKKIGYDYTGRLQASLNGKELINGEAKYTLKNGRISSSVDVDVQNRKLIDAEVDAKYQRVRGGYSGSVKADLNKKTLFDGDASMQKDGAKYAGAVTLRTPMRSRISGDFSNKNGEISASADFNRDVQITISQKGIQDAKIRISTPTRTTVLSTQTVTSSRTFSHKTMLVWDEENQKKVSVELDLNDRSSGRKKVYTMSGKLETPIRTLAVKGDTASSSGKCDSALTIQWDADRQPDKQLTLKTAYVKKGEQHNTVITISHPEMQPDIIIRNELVIGGSSHIFKSLVELKHTDDARDNIAMSVSLEKGRGTEYTAKLGVSQPKNMIDVDLSSTYVYSPRVVSATFNANYMTIRRRKVTSSLQIKLDKKMKELNIQMDIPGDSYELSGKLNKMATLKVTRNDRPLLDGTAKIDNNGADLQINVDDDVFHAYGKYETPTKMKAEVYRLINGRRTTDLQLDMNLKNKHILHSRMYLRPSLINDVQSNRIMTDVSNKISGSSAGMMKAVRQELSGRQYYLKRMVPNVTPLNNYIQSEASSFSNDYQDMRDGISRMVKNNEFYSNDIMEEMGNAIDTIGSATEKSIAKMQETMTTLQRKISELKNALEAKYPVYREKVLKAVQPLYVSYLRALEVIQDRYNEMINTVQSHHRVRRSVEQVNMLREYTNSVVDYITAPVKNAHVNVKNLIRQINDRLADYANKASGFVTKCLDKYQDTMDTIFEKLSSYEYPEYAKNFVKEVINQVQWYTQAFEKDSVKRFAQNAIHTTVQSARKNAVYLISQYLHLEKYKLIEYDLENGVIEFQVYIPFELPELKNLPDYHIADAWNRIKNTVNSYIPDERYSVWDTFYKYKPSSDMYDWIPPFKAYAVISGNQHYTTFDKRHFEFAGRCSYVLARDFVNARFSVMVNYANGRKRSLTVLSNGKNIEIGPNFQVTVDRKKIELPVQFADTYITRDGHMLTVENKKGMTLECNMVNDVCTLGISGWFYGKTAGLLGTYDNEPSNDFLTPERKQAPTPGDLANKWQVVARCDNRNLARVHTPEPETPSFRACAALFQKEESPLRTCFKIVNPEAFFEKCINEAEEDSGKGVCKVAAMYVTVCKREGVPLRIPSICVRCETPMSEALTEGQEMKIEGGRVPKSADIVFVVEEKKCAKKAAFKLKSLISAIEKSLMRSGLRDNKYGLVGFGGTGVYEAPSTHSVNGQLFGDARSLSRSLVSSLAFADKDEIPDSLEAIRKAARYPFRAGVSKTIVLLSCSKCQEQKVKQNELLRVLDQNDIRLHMLRHEDFQVSSAQNKPLSTDLFGIDSNSAFTSKHVSDKKLLGDKELFTQIVSPANACIKLAQVTGGSVFNIEKMIAGRANSEKYFTDVFSRRVSKSAEPEKCQICECSADPTGSPVSMCRPCHKAVQNNFTQIFGQTNRSKAYHGFDVDFEEYMQSPVVSRS